MERHLLIAHLPKQINARPLLLADGELDLVPRQRCFDRLTKRGFRGKEPIRWQHAADPLVRAKVVVVRNVVRQSLARFGKILRVTARPKLRVHRLPEALALSHCLRVVRARDHVLDPFSAKQFLKIALPSPGEVLPSLVGQHFLRLPEALDPIQKGLGDDLLALVRKEPKTHHVAAVVVEEDDEVHPLLVAGEEETRDVALPEITRPRALEASHDALLPRPLLRCAQLRWDAAPSERAPDPARAHANPPKSQKIVADLPESELRKLNLGACDGALNERRQPPEVAA